MNGILYCTICTKYKVVDSNNTIAKLYSSAYGLPECVKLFT